MTSKQLITRFAITLSSVIVALPAHADPPGRVARISFISGPASFRPGSVDEWTTATVNYPMTVGDHIWTDAGGRVELEMGSTVVRLSRNTEMSVLNLDDHIAQLRVTQGSVVARVRTLAQGDAVEIDTPNGATVVSQPGFYRVDVNEGGDTTSVTVRSGGAELATGNGSFPLAPGQAASLTGLDSPVYSARAAAATDDFEDWSLTRDRRAETAVSIRYAPGMIGYSDLDAYGQWQTVAEYGPVWVPRVAVAWAPYRFGHWVWVEPWGWTWVDDAPWGFAPFHYGRWAHIGPGWAWVPGPIVVRPVYAPALVAFVGGTNWSVSMSLGAQPVGWFPLGPREPFVPAYHVTGVYLSAVNYGRVSVTTATYVNREVPGAITAVPRDVFVGARPVGAVAVVVRPEAVRTSVMMGTAAIVPERVSIVGEARGRVYVPPAAVVDRRVVARAVPPPPPVAFAARREALTAHPGMPLDEAAMASLRAREAARPAPLVRSAPVVASRPGTAVARPAPPPQDLAARHAQEQAEIETRHAQELANIQAQHQRAEAAAASDKQREQMRQQHAQETKQLQARQQQEHEQMQKRQEQERKAPPKGRQ